MLFWPGFFYYYLFLKGSACFKKPGPKRIHFGQVKKRERESTQQRLEIKTYAPLCALIIPPLPQPLAGRTYA